MTSFGSEQVQVQVCMCVCVGGGGGGGGIMSGDRRQGNARGIFQIS